MSAQRALLPGAFSPADAVIDGPLRYLLTRQWSEDGRWIVWCLLNPSTADAEKNDPTLHRMMAFSRGWGFCGLRVVNLFAHMSPSPDELLRCAEPVGRDNDEWIATALRDASLVVVGWGDAKAVRKWPKRVDHVLGFIHKTGSQPMHLGLTKSGAPKHPLARGLHRIPDDVVPQPFVWRGAP